MAIIRLSNDRDKLAEYQFGLTCEKAIESIPISVIKKNEPIAFQFAFDTLLSILWDNVSVNQKFSIGQIPMIREAIFTRYYFLTIDEVAYVIKNGTIGNYKKEYNKLDLETLMTWFEIYDTSERMEWLDKRNHNEKIEALKLQESFKGVSSEFVSGMVAKIAKENNIKIEYKDDLTEKEKAYQAYKMKYLNKKAKE